MVYIVFVEGAGDRLDLHVLTHSFPTRRAADLEAMLAAAPALAVVVGADGRIAPPERLTGWLGLTDRPRYLSELGTSETGLSDDDRSEEHTSELQSLMRKSYAVFCLKKTKSRNITGQY